MASMPKKSANIKSKIRNPLLGGHRGREPNKFQFDITVDRVIGGTSTEYSIKWCRGVKTASTKKFEAAPKQKDGVAVNQKLSLLCTLYRTRAIESNDFEPKDTKLSLVSHKEGRKTEKAVGKVHFNLSDFAGVPSATTSHTFQLNPKTSVAVTIACTFVRISRGTASSCGSGLSGMTVSSGELEGQGNDDFADLDDIPSPAGNDVLSPVSAVTDSRESPRPGAEPRANEPGGTEFYEDENTPLRVFTAASPHSLSNPARSMSGRRKDSIRTSSAGALKSKSKVASLTSEVEQLQHQLAEAQKETEKSRVLHQMSEEIIRELREKIEYSNGRPAGTSASRETERQAKVDDLEKKLAMGAIETKQMRERYESRIQVLNIQVDAMERAKARLKGETRTIREQLETLENSAASKDSVLSAGLEAETRQKLLNEASDLRKENERLSRELDMRCQQTLQLESTQKEMTQDMERLHAKLDAHEQHAVQVKDTYTELSKMYTDLRDEHTKLHAELRVAKQIAKSAASSRSSSFGDKTRLLRRSNKGGSQTNDDEAECEAEARERELEEAKNELQQKKMGLVDSERARSDAEKQAANLESDLAAAKDKIVQIRREVDGLMERLETSKAKHLHASEQHEVALQCISDQKLEMEILKKQFQLELQQLRSEKLEESKRLRQAAIQSANTSPKGNDNERIRNLEASLAEAATREDQYEEEILKMTQIMDGLSNKLTETKALVAAENTRASNPQADGALTSTRNLVGAAAIFGSATGSSSERPVALCCRKCDNAMQLDDAASESASQEGSFKRSRTGLGRFLSKKGSNMTQSNADEDNFISSSRIRKMNLFEKITDGRLLNLLVETKMKLAVAEEEKVRMPMNCATRLDIVLLLLWFVLERQLTLARYTFPTYHETCAQTQLALEHLIRRVRQGDKHVQSKLAEHASRLEVKLNQANVMLANLQDEQHGEDSTLGKREALRQFNPPIAPTVLKIEKNGNAPPKPTPVPPPASAKVQEPAGKLAAADSRSSARASASASSNGSDARSQSRYESGSGSEAPDSDEESDGGGSGSNGDGDDS
jgi:hypothetical protein